MEKLSRFNLALLICVVLASCAGSTGTADDHSAEPVAKAVPATFEDGSPAPPEWSKNLTIYEVNVRQYSEAGDFAAITADLPRLKELGVGILWLMPIHPISELNRKGGLGSYYAVRDYKGINPDYGDAASFQALVDAAHANGMYLILDWVANHTGWDNPWTQSNPDWYMKDSTGNFTPPVADWSDVIHLDYSNTEMRAAMVDALEYWVREFNIDGYRCDVAGMVPTDFWNDVRAELDSIKPVFMLAEAEVPEHHDLAFDMSYGWDMHHALNAVASGEHNASHIDTAIAKKNGRFDSRDYLMNFTSNHDENTWNGTVFERMGDNYEAMAVLTFGLEGMPLIYSGQEAPMRKRLEFFEKDAIDWSGYELQDFYSKLTAFRKEQPALWSGLHGQPLVRLESPADIFMATRGGGDETVFMAFNFGKEVSEAALPEKLAGAHLHSPLKGEVNLGETLSLEPGGYLIGSIHAH